MLANLRIKGIRLVETSSSSYRNLSNVCRVSKNCFYAAKIMPECISVAITHGMKYQMMLFWVWQENTNLTNECVLVVNFMQLNQRYEKDMFHKMSFCALVLWVRFRSSTDGDSDKCQCEFTSWPTKSQRLKTISRSLVRSFMMKFHRQWRSWSRGS